MRDACPRCSAYHFAWFKQVVMAGARMEVLPVCRITFYSVSFKKCFNLNTLKILTSAIRLQCLHHFLLHDRGKTWTTFLCCLLTHEVRLLHWAKKHPLCLQNIFYFSRSPQRSLASILVGRKFRTFTEPTSLVQLHNMQQISLDEETQFPCT